MTIRLTRRAFLDALAAATATSSATCSPPAIRSATPTATVGVAQRLARAFGPWKEHDVAKTDALAVRLADKLRPLDSRAVESIEQRIPAGAFAVDGVALGGLAPEARATLVAILEAVGHDGGVLAELWGAAEVGACDGDLARHARPPRA